MAASVAARCRAMARAPSSPPSQAPASLRKAVAQRVRHRRVRSLLPPDRCRTHPHRQRGHRDPGREQQRAVALRLGQQDLEAWHRHDVDLLAVGGERLARRHGQVQLRPGGRDDGVRIGAVTAMAQVPMNPDTLAYVVLAVDPAATGSTFDRAERYRRQGAVMRALDLAPGLRAFSRHLQDEEGA